jgi:Tol biopolymer transport system component
VSVGHPLSTIYEKTLSGGSEKLLLTDPLDVWPTDWSSDGRFIALQRLDLRTKWDLLILPLEGDHKPTPFVQTEFNESEATFSPDGDWIAYTSDESGKPEVYIQPVVATLSGHAAKRSISEGGGAWPKWRRDGKELFYLALDGKLMSVDLRAGTGSSFDIGTPRVLFQASSTDLIYSVTRDGQRFLFNVPTKEPASRPATLVVNWAAGLKR